MPPEDDPIDPPASDTPTTQMVPKRRLDEALGKLRKAQAEADSIRREAEQYQEEAAAAQTLAARVKELEGALETERAGRQEDAAITSAGFADPELVRFFHERATRGQEDGPSISDWINDLKENPDKMPDALKSSVASGEPPAADPPANKSKPGTTDRDTGGKPPGPGKGAPMTTAERNQALKDIPHRQGSPEWREAANQIMGAGKS